MKYTSISENEIFSELVYRLIIIKINFGDDWKDYIYAQKYAHALYNIKCSYEAERS